MAGRKQAARAASTSMSGSNRAGPSPKYAAQPLHYRGRSSAACLRWPARNGGKRNGMAFSSTTTRTRRTAPPARLIQFGLFRMHASPHHSTGTKFPIAIQPTSRSSPFRNASPNSAIHTRIWTMNPAASNIFSKWRNATKPRDWATPHGLRTFGRWRARPRGWRLHGPNLPPRNPHHQNPEQRCR